MPSLDPSTMTVLRAASREMPESRAKSTPPATRAEIRVFQRLWTQYSEVVASCCRFDAFSVEASKDLRQSVAEYCLRRIHLYLDRYAPIRDRNDYAGIERALRARMGEERGAFRMWVRATVKWVKRDYLRGRRAADMEVSYDAPRDDESGPMLDQLRAAGVDGGQESSVEAEHAADVVAELLPMLGPDVERDAAIFLAACECDDPAAFYRAHRTTPGVLADRLSRKPVRDLARLAAARLA